MVAVVALGAGFVGSVARDWIATTPRTIRAKRFEVIGAADETLSYWGPDSDPRIPSTTPKGILLVFMDPSGSRRCQIGSRIGDYGPELLLYDKGGPSQVRRQEYVVDPRVSLTLGFNGDPLLAMRDHSTWRVFLGAEHGDAPSVRDDDWRIMFRSRTNAMCGMGTHGVSSEKSQAYVSVSDEHGKTASLPSDFQYEFERVPLIPRRQ
jgi:hypothetical protein